MSKDKASVMARKIFVHCEKIGRSKKRQIKPTTNIRNRKMEVLQKS